MHEASGDEAEKGEKVDDDDQSIHYGVSLIACGKPILLYNA